MFFFQAEDGIRDIGVTGVQTCALPISSVPEALATGALVIEDLNSVGFDERALDRKSTRLNSSHANISYAVFCLKKKNNYNIDDTLHHKEHHGMTHHLKEH